MVLTEYYVVVQQCYTSCMNAIPSINRCLSLSVQLFLVMIIGLFSSTTYSRTPGEFFIDEDGDVGYLLEKYIGDCFVHEDIDATGDAIEYMLNRHNTVKLAIVNSVQHGGICILRDVEQRNMDMETYSRIPGDIYTDSYGEVVGYVLEGTIDYCFVLEESGITEDNYRGIENNNNTVVLIVINSMKHGYVCAVKGVEQLPI